MTRMFLATWLLTQTWAWTPVPDATHYRIYWGATGQAWCTTDYIEVAASVCTPIECQGDIPIPSFDLSYIIIVARNAAGLGPTEHGAITVCP